MPTRRSAPPDWPTTSPDRALRQHAALVQHHDVVVVSGFVDQMRRPEHADALRGREPPNMLENVGARFDVEADRRLVEQQQPWAMQQRACDFDRAASARSKGCRRGRGCGRSSPRDPEPGRSVRRRACWRCRAARHDTSGSAGPKYRHRARATGTPRRAGSRPRPARARHHGRKCGSGRSGSHRAA